MIFEILLSSPNFNSKNEIIRPVSEIFMRKWKPNDLYDNVSYNILYYMRHFIDIISWRIGSTLSFSQWIKQWSEDLTPSTEAPFIPICSFMPTSKGKFQTLDFSCQSWPNFQWEETKGFSLPSFVRFDRCSCIKHVWGANVATPLFQFFKVMIPFHVCICFKDSSYWRRGQYLATLEKFGIKVIRRDSKNVINYSKHIQWEQNILQISGVLHWG